MPEPKEHISKPTLYLTVLAALMALLALTIVMAFLNIDSFTARHHLGSGWNTAIAISIAIAKGLLILLFFMHAKYSSRLTWVFAAAGFVWLAIMIGLTMTDYMSRNHPPGANSKGEPVYLNTIGVPR